MLLYAALTGHWPGSGLSHPAARAARGRAPLQPAAGQGGRARRARRDHLPGPAAAGPGRRLPADHAGAAVRRAGGGDPAGADSAAAAVRRGRAPTAPGRPAGDTRTAPGGAGDRKLVAGRTGTRVLVAGRTGGTDRPAHAVPAPGAPGPSRARLGIIAALVVAVVRRVIARRRVHRAARWRQPRRPARRRTRPSTAAQQHGSWSRSQPVSAQGFEENTAGANLAIDNNPQTDWQTHWYLGNPVFGGLQQGSGLILDMGRSGQAELGDGHVRVDPRAPTSQIKIGNPAAAGCRRPERRLERRPRPTPAA